jgi:hypothetical protein
MNGFIFLYRSYGHTNVTWFRVSISVLAFE